MTDTPQKTFRTEALVDRIMVGLGFKEADALDYYTKRNLVAHSIDEHLEAYRDRVIENYMVGTMSDYTDKHAGCIVYEVGEGDGLVILTKSLQQAIKSYKCYWRDTAGEEPPDFTEADFKPVRVWLYKRPECEGDDVESYFDFSSKHPNAKPGFVIYF